MKPITRLGLAALLLSTAAAAYDYYSRFDNVFTGPGIVEHGLEAGGREILEEVYCRELE